MRWNSAICDNMDGLKKKKNMLGKIRQKKSITIWLLSFVGYKTKSKLIDKINKNSVDTDNSLVVAREKRGWGRGCKGQRGWIYGDRRILSLGGNLTMQYIDDAS